MLRSRLAVCLTSALLLAGCGTPANTKTTDTAVSETDSSEARIAERAREILSRMTVEEKIGQVIQADIASVTPEEVRTYNLGSVLNGGNSAPGNKKVASPQEWIALADAFWDASTDTSDGGVGVPAIWGTDAVHGHNNLAEATIFPHNIGLGAAHDPEMMGRIGKITAIEVRATGVDWTFAPTLAVAQDDRWGRAYESYSENPELVASYADAMVYGLQGQPGTEDFLKGDNLMATAKHFIGDGGTHLGIDKGDTQGDLSELLKIHGAGYLTALDADVQAVMASFSSINGEKMHGNKALLTDYLRGELGFEGFVVGDWNGHAEIPGCTATDCVASLMAGVDMYMAPDSWKGIYESLLATANAGELDMDRLDEAVLRILKVKIRSGLLDGGKPSTRASSDPARLGAPDHLAVAREAVRKSLVLLKNEDGVLPIKPGQNILMAGSGADSMQQQTGGWTLSWQGDDNTNSEFKAGETIFAGMKEAVENIGGSVSLSEDGSYSTKPDVAIVVFGEDPYAEYRGDRSDLVYEFEGGPDLALLEKLKADGIPVVSVFLSGRPMWMNPHINASDAFVAAWLPGSEGAGVSDVLVADETGNARYDFEGRLSFTWPSDGTGTPINADSKEGVLFPYGFGLSYVDDGSLAELSEDPGVQSSAENFTGLIMERGDGAGGLQVFLADTSSLNTPATALSATSFNGSVETTGVDYRAQEDARQIVWTGAGDAALSIRSSGVVEVKTYHKLIELTWQVTDAPEGGFEIGMGCGDGCSGLITVSPEDSAALEGDWRTDTISLACLEENGLDRTNVTELFRIDADTPAKVTLHKVNLIDEGEASLACAAPAIGE